MNEALCTSDCNAATATISSNINGIGNGNSRSIEWLTDGNHSSIRHNHHHHHQTTIPYVPSQSFQTYHIYDDTDLVTMKTNLDESKQQQQQQQQSGIVRKSKNPKDVPDLIEDDSTDHYIRNVEQVVKSLSEKLQLQQQQQQQQLQNDENGHHLISNHHNNNQYHRSSIDHGRNLSFRSNSLSYDGDDYRSTTASSLSTLQLQQTPSRRFIMNGIDNNQNNRSTGEQRRRNMSITSLISLQQQQPNTMDRLRSLISRSNHHQNRNDNNNNLLINKNRSLPASPLMNTNRKEMNLNLQTTSSSITTTTTATRQRSSNGRHFFHSPKVVRKLRRK